MRNQWLLKSENKKKEEAKQKYAWAFFGWSSTSTSTIDYLMWARLFSTSVSTSQVKGGK